MDGHGGQTYTIDFDRGRIVATMAIHRDFNWKKIAHSVIKKGKAYNILEKSKGKLEITIKNNKFLNYFIFKSLNA